MSQPLAAHQARHGAVPVPRPGELDALVEQVQRSGLTGRGGGGYPTGRKLAAVVAGALGAERVVVAGEESALVSFVRGRAALPTTKPPRPAERGVGGRPTFVSNAQTFAHLALVARHGARWFRGLGTDEEPGSVLVTARGAVARPGVYEAELGTPLTPLLAGAGGATEPIQHFLVGGFGGSFVDAAAAARRAWSRAGLAPVGATPGAGLLLAVPARAVPAALVPAARRAVAARPVLALRLVREEAATTMPRAGRAPAP